MSLNSPHGRSESELKWSKHHIVGDKWGWVSFKWLKQT